ncbi:MAG: IS1634 family transposase [Chloroflexaceae bacterium]
MNSPQIERVDAIPILVTWLTHMAVAEHIDSYWTPHREWEGLRYGQLAVRFLTFVLHERDHRLSVLADWVAAHHATLTVLTGWTITPADVTDDRLGRLVEVLGQDASQITAVQQALGRHVIRVYALPTTVARIDTTSVTVTHAPSAGGQPERAVLQVGSSKDQRPDVLQFKQTLATRDPGGVPLLRATVAGTAADAPLSVPTWQDLVALLGHADFLVVADSKAAALRTRATIAGGGGRSLVPMPLTGDVPALLRSWVLTPPVTPLPVVLPPTQDAPPKPRAVGLGFEVVRRSDGQATTGQAVQWDERWLVVQRTAYAQRQQQALTARVQRAEADLARFRVKQGERADAVQERVDAILKRYDAADMLTVGVAETAIVTRRSARRGRPRATPSVEEVTTYQVQVSVQRNEEAIAEAQRLAGWRISVTNRAVEDVSLVNAMALYREEWTVEHGYHRWNGGWLPALPLFRHIEQRIRGLMLLLLIALQVLSLIAWQARRSLAAEQATLPGLVPGNPKMATAQPTAERLLRMFTHVHLLIHQVGDQRLGQVLEAVTPLQQRILHLLRLPVTLYSFQARLSTTTTTAGG